MRLLTPDLSEGAKRDIEEAIRDPADKAIQMLGLVTTSLPAADDEKSSFGWIFDTTLGQPKFSDGTSWLTFSLSNHTHTSFGALTISGAINLTGGQIGFPATQVPSADANTLDDYEEGTWTPDLQFGGASVGMAYASRSGTYTKVGRLVTVQFYLELSAKGSSTGGPTISGLPFPVGSIASACAAGVTLASGLTVPYVRAESGTSYMVVIDFAGSGMNGISQANFTNTTQVYATITYQV